MSELGSPPTARREGRYPIDRVDWKDDLSYVREMYGVPAVRGARVLFNRELGTIIGASGAYIVVQLDEGDRSPFILHPTWRVEYLDAGS